MGAAESLLRPAAASSGWVLPQDLVFVDLETTGCTVSRHRIIEIGIVRLVNGECVEEWSSLVDPECAIPVATQGFTGITQEMVAGAPTFAEIAPLVREKLSASVFVAHNARFDYAFLRAEFRRLEQRFIARVLCSVRLSRRLFPDEISHNLDAVIERHALVCPARHRALGDAKVLADFWRTLLAERAHGELAAAVESALDAQRLPAHLPEGLADDLPDGPGAYRFFGEGDALLYVGRAKSLRTRILAHFPGAAAAVAPRGLGEAVRRIDWQESIGELGAAFKEAEWIERGHPLRNRRPTAGAEVTIRCAAPEALGAAPAAPAGRGAAPAPLIEIAPLRTLDPRGIASCFGVFQGPAQAGRALTAIARAHRLCLKELGLEQSEGSCIAHQLGDCKGACIGREPRALHAVRVQMALASLRLKPWPFPGRIAVCERDARGECELHVLEHWVYLGTARSEEELERLARQTLSSDAGVDPHCYRILMRHLAAHPALEWRELGRP